MASWPDKDREVLAGEWNKGTSAAQIGKILGRTRNSVIGMAHRMRLPGRQSVKRSTNKPREKSVPAARKSRAPFLVTRGDPTKKKKVEAVPPPPSVTDGVGIDLMKLRAHHCHDVIGYRNGNLGDAVYCGAPTHRNTSFCEYHHGIYFRDPNERR